MIEHAAGVVSLERFAEIDHMSHDEMGSLLLDTMVENAKLRKLVKDIHTLATDYGVCIQYPYCDTWDEKLAVVEKQMRDLGVEVDDGAE